NIPVQVTGIGFFDFAHNQHGAAPNVIELHPILDIVFNPQPGGDFSILVPSTSINLPEGGTSSIVVTAASTSGPAPNVTFSTSGLPPGFTPQSTPGPAGKSTLPLTASAAAPAGSFPFTITGTSGQRSHPQTLTLNITALPQNPPTGQEWEYKVISANSEQDV